MKEKGNQVKLLSSNMNKLVSVIDDEVLETLFRNTWQHIFKSNIHDGMQVLSVLYNELIKRDYRIWVSQLPTLYSPKDIKEYQEKKAKGNIK